MTTNTTPAPVDPLFELGELLITPKAQTVFKGTKGSALLPQMLRRHATGDWSEMHVDDAQANRDAVANGGRVFSAFRLPHGSVWIITEADRSATTIMTPSEY